ncbi:MAG TPA: ROK family protein [Chitinophagaceae bacterium]|nr:ROK family protein [Chitinophagaceae bacterium]
MQEQQKDLYIGVDIGGTRTKFGLVDIISGQVLESMVQPTETLRAQVFIEQVQEVLESFTAVALAQGRRVKGIGFGIPGFTNAEGLVVTTYDFLRFMEDYPLQQIIQEKCGVPCRLDNDARTIALGEALYGAGKHYKRVLTLTLGTGLGVGMVVDGAFTNALPLAHMGGHITITQSPERCYCGKTGCLESLVSASAFAKAAEACNGLEASVPGVLAAAADGRKDALQIVETIAGYLHTGIHNYVNLLAPDIIVLGGGIAKGLQPYLPLIKGQSYAAAYPAYQFELVVSSLQELAGIAGSAALFIQQNTNRP